ncbi:hypothetical protein [Burkholderia gladioli]|uniref:hypothetical protein n=1 Tax=Burkholderia gladioli TaxID=28095 RepID=UPI00163DE933|nr:hypothetical protein [Burkholderia gladioli]MBU9268713.1 hypothetical protein [Burkholderia gladioli]MCH7274668.1 hypothetical protein [Burkholderia gladioli]MDN7806318.1 hypothetical protein [Burkholderia gladioli]
MGKKVTPFGARALRISEIVKYEDGHVEEIIKSYIELINDPKRHRDHAYLTQFPHKTFALIDQLVRQIAASQRWSPSYWGGKMVKEKCYSDDLPFQRPKYEMVIRPTKVALASYAGLRALYALLSQQSYWESKYCVTIEVARRALQFAYPTGFIDLPPTNIPRPDDVPEMEFQKGLTELIGPAAQCYNTALDKIAEMTNASDFRSKLARERAKLRVSASSAVSLIYGLLHHHKALTVIAIRLSIRKSDGHAFIGAEMKKALTRLLADRRNDVQLKDTIGYFWLLQESFDVSLRQHLSTVKAQGSNGGIALHYDLVLFFSSMRCTEMDDILGHIAQRWRRVTGGVGISHPLRGKDFTPYSANSLVDRMAEIGKFQESREFVGVVFEDSTQARNLVEAARAMVFCAELGKSEKRPRSATLIHDKTHRFGKSDLLTGCGYTKEGRGTKKGNSGLTFERVKRLPYSK